MNWIFRVITYSAVLCILVLWWKDPSILYKPLSVGIVTLYALTMLVFSNFFHIDVLGLNLIGSGLKRIELGPCESERIVCVENGEPRYFLTTKRFYVRSWISRKNLCSFCLELDSVDSVTISPKKFWDSARIRFCYRENGELNEASFATTHPSSWKSAFHEVMPDRFE